MKAGWPPTIVIRISPLEEFLRFFRADDERVDVHDRDIGPVAEGECSGRQLEKSGAERPSSCNRAGPPRE